jgi:hypothetical protein
LESLSFTYNEVHLYLQVDKIRLSCTAQPRRTTAEEDVLALIAPLGKLIVTHLLEKKSAASSKRPGLPSGTIRVNTSCSALVLLGTAALSSKLELVLRSKALRYKLFFLKALAKQLWKLTIKTKRLSQLKSLSFLNFND